MGTVVGVAVVLVLVLLMLRRTSIYLYIWVPLVTNLLTWGCLGACLSLAMLMAPRTHGGPAPSLADFFLLVGAFAGYLLLLAIAAIAVLPPRAAWKKEAIRAPVLVAVALFFCILLAFTRFVVH